MLISDIVAELDAGQIENEEALELAGCFGLLDLYDAVVLESEAREARRIVDELFRQQGWT